MLDPDTIYTDEEGRPIERPKSPPAEADIEARIAYMREAWAYHDRVHAVAVRNFNEAFSKAMRR